MDRRTVLTVAAVGAANLAGCVGGGDDQSGDLPGATDEPGGDDGSGDGDGDSGGDDWVSSEPDQALQDAGSFTSQWTWETSESTEGGAEKLEYTSEVNLDEERAYTKMQNYGDDQSTLEMYQADGRRYNRATDSDGENPTTWAEDREFEPREFLFSYGYGYSSSELEDWSDEGTETYDGVTVRRYVYDGDDLYVNYGQGQGQFSEVNNLDFVMLIDEKGIPRYQKQRIEGVNDEGEDVWVQWEYTITDVGSTTVEEPDWVTDDMG